MGVSISIDYQYNHLSKNENSLSCYLGSAIYAIIIIILVYYKCKKEKLEEFQGYSKLKSPIEVELREMNVTKD